MVKKASESQLGQLHLPGQAPRTMLINVAVDCIVKSFLLTYEVTKCMIGKAWGWVELYYID